ncbi:uncharacterized protein K452DRAFT_350275 [Aplosporella prunicola CBS 121167]|uniref:tRNA(Phe) (4-demethylwyosine(37)-C(7)) aminocarboxypropyltransferase n=1 Tax=Aplosporella prunicola CBS 121167 TaxID=1176127 RepID=A0A6A6BIE2_9PEZI|nr:uncharacterized protein K452DRAFT_350275 [Aplosporella prunicola CBS 121167]KAF2143910.1 hypothetical protein K452DRAFT_350275 [Aplosporella prunicola CBS 121167]
MPFTSLALVVPSQHVKTVKTALEEQGNLDRGRKISPYQDGGSSAAEKKFLVPVATDDHGAASNGNEATTTPTSSAPEAVKAALLQHLGQEILDRVAVIELQEDAGTNTPPRARKDVNPLQAAARKWLQSQSQEQLLSSLNPHINIDDLVNALPPTYSVYPPLLLLPATTFAAPPWRALLSALSPAHTSELYAALAHALHATHVAVNAPIAAQTPAPSSAADGSAAAAAAAAAPNILRSPSGLRPLLGDFGLGSNGTASSPQQHPTPAHFAAAFWVRARQNGIVQAWAPVHTMFSRGNVKEKARVLGDATAVDLYAGIGYFSFSYRRAGVRKVLGWELNPWSVEGLRRGAGANGWGVRVVDEEAEGREGAGGDFLVFRESNVHALDRIRALRASLPPIRHVNCGLLPTSRGSWTTAVEAVDPGLGGWVHLHENFGVGEIEQKAGETVAEVRRLVGVLAESRGGSPECVQDVALLHVERVKTYAPGVVHCVLDIFVPPTALPVASM